MTTYATMTNLDTGAVQLTTDSHNLFVAYAKDAGNWSGTPLVGGNVSILGAARDRGNLTDLKKVGLIETFISDGRSWVRFTDKGRAYAVAHNVEIDN